MTRNATNIEATPTTPALDSAVSAAQALLGSLRSAYVARDTESLCLVLALIGLVYVMFIAPRLLPARAPVRAGLPVSGRQFVAQIPVEPDSKLVGAQSSLGVFPRLPDVTVLMIQRGEQAILPPFDDLALSRSAAWMAVSGARAAIASKSDSIASVKSRSSSSAAGSPCVSRSRFTRPAAARVSKGATTVGAVRASPTVP